MSFLACINNFNTVYVLKTFYIKILFLRAFSVTCPQNHLPFRSTMSTRTCRCARPIPWNRKSRPKQKEMYQQNIHTRSSASIYTTTQFKNSTYKSTSCRLMAFVMTRVQNIHEIAFAFLELQASVAYLLHVLLVYLVDKNVFGLGRKLFANNFARTNKMTKIIHSSFLKILTRFKVYNYKK